MGKKSLINAHCLLELIEKSPLSIIKTFCEIPECQAFGQGFNWSQDASKIHAALLEHVKHLRKDQREPAEREALRILRLATPRGATLLSAVADQLNDSGLAAIFAAQDGAEIGRSIWMRTHSDDAGRLFDVAESILNTGDIRGNKRLYDAFEVPCHEAPPFLWNDSVKKELELHLTRAMRLSETCEVVYVPLEMENKNGDTETTHYLVVRFAGDQVSAVQVVNRNRRSFCYFPARDVTLIYSPDRKVVEVYAHALSSRAPLANVLSKYGFKAPLSSRPLNHFSYDLSRFTQPLRDEKPRLEGATVERLYLTEAKALIGHATDAVTLHLDSGKELQDVIGGRWSDHPFSQPGAILSVTLVVDLVFDGETTKTPLSIVLTESGRCSLQGEKDPRLKQAGTQLLEALGVLKPSHPGVGINDPRLLIQVAKLLECATSPMDGFALAQLGIDIDRFEDEGILTKGDRITHKVVDLADNERMTVQLERCADGKQMRYHDPFTGNDVVLLAKHARRWRVDLNWLHEALVTALGSALQVVRGRRVDEDPVYLGEMDMDGQKVCLYFAAKMSNERQYAKVDLALRLRPTAIAGIVLTTTSRPFPFAGTNVVIPIENVLATRQDSSAIDLAQLKLAYRHGQRAASGSASVSLKVSPDGNAAMLHLPGKAPWQVTSKGKIAVLQRLVNAYANGTPHVNTKALMDGSNCASPANLFPKTSPWRDYLAPVKGARAWQLKVQFLANVMTDDESDKAAVEEVLNL